jgi:hypothetical protein
MAGLMARCLKGKIPYPPIQRIATVCKEVSLFCR